MAYVIKITLTKPIVDIPLKGEKIHSHTHRFANTFCACIPYEHHIRGAQGE